VNVSQPDALLTWLDKNDPSHIIDLHVIVEAYCKAHPTTRWGQLFEKLGREAINLQHLFVLLDAEGPTHRGLGNDLCFSRALVQLKVKRITTINGCYAKDLPEYIGAERR